MDTRYSDVDCVVADPLRFKVALAIGEDAYASLRYGNKVKEWWDLVGAAGTGAAVAQSTVVASTFFAPNWLLATLGLSTAVTPIGWVIAAALASGGAWYGIQRGMNAVVDGRITKVPKFINTPIDVLAVSLFDLLAPLALKLAQADGKVTEVERQTIRGYFVQTWGLDHSFTTNGIAHLEERLSDFTIEDIAYRLAELQKSSPDCNFDAMSQSLLEFLSKIVEADGYIDEAEQMAIDSVRAIFAEAGRSALTKKISGLGDSVNRTIKKTTGAVSVHLEVTKTRMLTLAEEAANTDLAIRTTANANKMGEMIRDRAEKVGHATRSATERTLGRIKITKNDDS